MSLFNQILGAINNPEQEANPNQLASILDTVQQLSGNYNANPSAIESAMSIVGSFTRSALQNQRSNGGEGQVRQTINQFAGTQANYQVLQALFNNSQLQNMTQQISNRTGLDTQIIQSLLPVLVPLVLNFLKTGNNTNNSQASNSLLNSFLDGDRDGDVDLVDAISMASRFLGR
ncbi:hypothetical protein STA3757_43740 [Stanieria sp. NIES-3757]|nr:hypothetical protein STA3757_43740 [Stanieria sp. NIES-3757]